MLLALPLTLPLALAQAGIPAVNADDVASTGAASTPVAGAAATKAEGRTTRRDSRCLWLSTTDRPSHWSPGDTDADVAAADTPA